MTRKYPLLRPTVASLAVQRRGTDASHDKRGTRGRLDIHPHDAQDRGIKNGDWVGVESRAGQTVMRAVLSENMQPGVIYTTFHFPESGANVITTDSSDWATNCPEYKVTAVQVMPVAQPSSWQRKYSAFHTTQLDLLAQARKKPVEVVGN